jgi:hypothetical protein
MAKNKIKIVILGGGTAGWLTALWIENSYDNVDITVLEDPSKPPIIAGESGGFALSRIYDTLGINFAHWGITVGATPKLGGKFVGWNGKDSVFYHSLITNYYKVWEKRFPSLEERYYYLRGLVGNNVPLCDIVPTGELLKNNKVPFSADGAIIDDIYPMWHFNSRENADYLKQRALERNITLVEGTYQHSEKLSSGQIDKIVLTNGTVLQASWFFDCSGFARLLLEKEMGVKSLDRTMYFPARAVLPWWDETVLNTGTLATTMDAGWTWQIGLRDRTGQGYLYDPDFLSEDQALKEIRTKFGEHIEPVAKLRFNPCILEKFQTKNVFGIGLSTGFMEPLEANGTGIIVDQLLALEKNWNPFVQLNEAAEKTYNKDVHKSYDGIKDFLSLHYRGKGLETEFWKEQSNPERTPDSLKQRIEEFTEWYKTGKIDFLKYHDGFSIESWLTVIQALDIIDYKLINLGEIGPFIDNYYKQQKDQYVNIQNRCIGIEQWISKVSINH